MIVLVTGGTGFVGRHLLRVLGARGHECRFTFAEAAPCGKGLQPALEQGHRLRLPCEDRCLEILREAQPEAVVHLAGMAFVPEAEESPLEAFEVNVEGTAGLLRALHQHDPRGRIRFVLASTSQVYDPIPAGTGALRGEVCLSEDSPLGPRNTYARTKLAAELVTEILAGASERTAVVLRGFNQIGPGQRDVFAVSSFARQVARIERGLREPVLETGSLEVCRDFCDVRDIAAAYALAAEGALAAGVYNLASGHATPLRAVVELLRGLSRRSFELRVQKSRVRAGEASTLRGDSRKILAACGWRAGVPLEASVRGALDWWRQNDDA